MTNGKTTDSETNSITHLGEVDYDYFDDILSKSKVDTDLNSAKSKFINQLNQLRDMVMSCDNHDTIAAASKHIKTAASIFNSLENQKDKTVSLLRKRQYAPNQNMDKQLKFYSTKKRRIGTTPILSKPSSLQSKANKDNLSNTETKFCWSCLKENDINHANQTISWIQCDNCSIWLHCTCAQNNLPHTLNETIIYVIFVNHRTLNNYYTLH